MGRFREAIPDILSYVKQLEQRIKNLETNDRAGYTSVDSGSLKINTSAESTFQIFIDGTLAFEIGSGPNLGNQYGMRLWRGDGTTGMFLTQFGSRQIVGMQDASLHTIVGDDGVTGFGLSRPWIPIPFYDDIQFAPARTTTSATFDTLQYSTYNIQHSFVTINSLVRCSDGTTEGEIIVRANDEDVNGTTVAIPAGSNTLFVQTINFSTLGLNHGTECELTVAARRTVGAGTVGVRVMHAYGRETLF